MNKSVLDSSRLKRFASKTSFDTGHGDSINDAKLDYFGTKVATASSDKTVRIFSVDSKTGAYHKLAELTGYTGQVWNLSWSHPKFGSLLASASYDGRIVIWKEETDDSFLQSKWAALFDEQVHRSSVNKVSWAPPQFGAILAAGSSDGSISILTLSDQECWTTARITKAHELGCQSVTWSPSQITRRLASAGNDSNIKLWRLDEDNEWVLETTLQGHSDWVYDVEWSPTEEVMASTGRDGKILIWTKLMEPEKPKWNHSMSFININMSNLEGCEEWVSRALHFFDKGSNCTITWDPMGLMLCTTIDDKILLWKKGLKGSWNAVKPLESGTTNESQNNPS